ncbi:hypothetical protein HDV06_004703 [Boothiomyces sp. JEL0866]|nr:hypothetical protein HDV06_004703 [Boothiomyces sp. JEL0866]
MKEKKRFGNSTEAVAGRIDSNKARKKAKEQEMQRRYKLKKNLSKLLKEEGLDTTSSEPKKVANSLIRSWKESNFELMCRTKVNPFSKAQKVITDKKNEKSAKREEFLKQKEERQEKLRQSREKRSEVHAKLSKKTKKGQPVMSNVITHLLDKIKKNKE